MTAPDHRFRLRPLTWAGLAVAAVTFSPGLAPPGFGVAWSVIDAPRSRRH